MKVLFIRYSALGDIVLTTGVIKSFQDKFPEADVHILTDGLGKEIFSNLGFVKRIFDIRGEGLFGVLRSLPKYDYVFDFQSKVKSKAISMLKGRQSFSINKGSKERRQFVKTKIKTEGLDKHITQRYFEASLGALNVKEPELNSLRPKLSLGNYKSKIQLPENFIAIHPYASQANKVWPYFSELIDELIERSYNVVVIGQSDVKRFNEKAINLTSKTSIKDLMYVIGSAHKLVTTDSGPLHIATGLNTPTLSLFGPTTEEFGFYPNYSDSVVIENKSLSCRPCHVHGGDVCPAKHFKCMRELTVNEVIRKFLI